MSSFVLLFNLFFMWYSFTLVPTLEGREDGDRFILVSLQHKLEQIFQILAQTPPTQPHTHVVCALRLLGPDNFDSFSFLFFVFDLLISM